MSLPSRRFEFASTSFVRLLGFSIHLAHMERIGRGCAVLGFRWMAARRKHSRAPHAAVSPRGTFYEPSAAMLERATDDPTSRSRIWSTRARCDALGDSNAIELIQPRKFCDTDRSAASRRRMIHDSDAIPMPVLQ